MLDNLMCTAWAVLAQVLGRGRLLKRYVLWSVEGFVWHSQRAPNLVIKKVGTDDNLADVGTEHIDDGQKLVHLLNSCGMRMKRTLEQTASSVATVVLHGFAVIVHVEVKVTGSTVAVTVRVSLEMITAATGRLGLWLVAGEWAKILLPRRTMTRDAIFQIAAGDAL